MRELKKAMVIGVCVMLLFGCSSKSSVKVGAMGGGTAGALLGGLLGAAASEGHTGNGKTAKNALIGAVVLGGIGALLGAGTGYVLDSVSNNDDKTQEMIQSHNIEGIH